jgi:flagellar hook-associated protein 3 FlgL
MSDMFRLSPLLQVDRTQRYLSDLKERIASTENAAMTGLSVTQPSDAPNRWSEIYSLEDGIEDQSAFRTNAESARSLLGAVDNALDQTGDHIDEALEVAITFSSDLLGPAERNSAADRIDALVQQIVSQANTNVAGRYVFAGQNYSVEAYDSATLAYNGSTDVPKTAVGDGVFGVNGVVGSDAFGTALTALTGLSTALRTGTTADVQNQIDPLQLARVESGAVRQQAGYEWMVADDALTIADNLEQLYTSHLNEVVGADPFETLSELAGLQTTFQTALQVTASTAGAGNLFSFLR